MMRGQSSSKNRAKSPAAISRKTSQLASSTATALEGVWEDWLQGLPASEDELLAWQRKPAASPVAAVDTGFDTSEEATFSPACFTEAEKESLKPVVWRRVTGQLLVPMQHYLQLHQGCLCRSRWLLGALVAVSTKQRLLLDLLVSDEHADAGLYTFQFYKHGAWRRVVVDNRLPCLEVQQRLAFASSSTPQELWPSLAEKAYARLHGGYAAIAQGCVADALIDLSGGMVDSISLAAGLEAEDAVWLHIMQTLSAGHIAVCTAEPHAASAAHSSAGATDPAGLIEQLQGVAGLAANSPYSILAAKVLPSGLKLLRLHNPWAPQGVWQGAWGPETQEWESAEGQAALAADPAMEEGLQDAATFWCSFWDFMQVFSTLYLLQLPGRQQQAVAVSAWGGTSATAGCRDPSQQQQVPGSSLMSDMQAAASPDSPQAIVQLGQQSDSRELGTDGQGQHKQQLMQNTVCQQVPAQCMAWAGRPQFKLMVAHSCEVVLGLGQANHELLAQGAPGNPWQQQQHGFQIGLRVSHAPHSSPALHPKALAAAGFSRPGTCATSSSMLTGSGRCSTSRGRSRSPRRPGTAPAVAAAAAAEEGAIASSLYRVWVPELHPGVADSGLCSSRDVVLRFVAQAGRTYVVMPYTRCANDNGPFVLRAWAPSAVTLEQLPTPYSLTQGGRWLGSSAGGGRGHTTWASNPHYLLTSRREATAVLCLQRPDVCNSLLVQPFEPSGRISLTVCQPVVGMSAAKAGTPAVVAAQSLAAAAAAAGAAGSKVVGATSYGSMDQTALLLQLMPNTPYVLVPSTAEPGVEAPFELTLLSSQPLELCELPRQCTMRHAGSWGEGTSGGSNLHTSWLHNPAFTLQLERKARCRISLSRTAGWRRNQPLGEMIGLSALKLPTAAGVQAPPAQQQQQHKQPPNSLTMLKQNQLHEAAFVPMQTCDVEWELPGGVPLLLVPCTYAPGVSGGFSLSVTTSGYAFSCAPVPGGLAALLASTGARVTRLTQH